MARREGEKSDWKKMGLVRIIFTGRWRGEWKLQEFVLPPTSAGWALGEDARALQCSPFLCSLSTLQALFQIHAPWPSDCQHSRSFLKNTSPFFLHFLFSSGFSPPDWPVPVLSSEQENCHLRLLSSHGNALWVQSPRQREEPVQSRSLVKTPQEQVRG